MTSSQKRLVIAIDCDDVLITTARHILDYYNERFGTQVGFEHFYDTSDSSLDIWGVASRDEAIQRVAQFLHSDKHAEIAPDPEVILAIKSLARQHELHLVSGRLDSLRPVTERMLQDYFPGCFKTIEHTNFIAPLGTDIIRRSKGDICRSINADILVDDHPHHASAALAADVKKVILFGDYAWNRRETFAGGVVRCENWPSAIKEINAYATGS